MDKNSIKNWIIIIILAVFAFLLGKNCSGETKNQQNNDPEPKIITIHDTLPPVRDTIYWTATKTEYINGEKYIKIDSTPAKLYSDTFSLGKCGDLKVSEVITIDSANLVLRDIEFTKSDYIIDAIEKKEDWDKIHFSPGVYYEIGLNRMSPGLSLDLDYKKLGFNIGFSAVGARAGISWRIK